MFEYDKMKARKGAGGEGFVRRIKTFDELTIQDNFIFQKAMRNKSLCKGMIERLLDIEIRDISYPEEEKTIALKLNSKNVRLDVYVRDEQGTVFNLEMQTVNDRNELAKRMRYYQASIDIDMLERGKDYSELNSTYIIFICTFPLFDSDLYKYTFRNICLEDYGIELKDGATKMFVTTRGKRGEISEELRRFLAYVDGKGAEGGFASAMDEEVQKTKSCEEWRREYMTWEMELIT